MIEGLLVYIITHQHGSGRSRSMRRRNREGMIDEWVEDEVVAVVALMAGLAVAAAAGSVHETNRYQIPAEMGEVSR